MAGMRPPIVVKKTLPMDWQKASSQVNIRPPPQKQFNMIKLKKKNQKNRENLKMPYLPFI